MSKKTINGFQLLDNIPAGQDVASRPINIQYMDNVGMRVAWQDLAFASISISIQGSNDSENWTDLSFAPALTVPGATPGDYLINMNQVPYGYLRLRFLAGLDTYAQANATIQDISYYASYTSDGTNVLEDGGNNVSVELVNPGPSNNLLRAEVDVENMALRIILATDSNGDSISTADDIMAVLNNTPSVGLVLSMGETIISGTGSNIQVAEGPTNLAGGAQNPGVLNVSVNAKEI